MSKGWSRMPEAGRRKEELLQRNRLGQEPTGPRAHLLRGCHTIRGNYTVGGLGHHYILNNLTIPSKKISTMDVNSRVPSILTKI